MLSFLFWNLNRKEEAASYIARLGLTYTIDLFLCAECPSDPSPIVRGLNALNRGVYHLPAGTPAKVQLLSRLPQSQLTQRFTNIAGDMTIWRLQTSNPPFVLLAAAHLPSKMGGATEADQQSYAQLIAGELAEIEDQENCQDTMLVGDLNMNPSEPGVTSVAGLHGLMTRALAALPPRQYRRRVYRRFYNPMWGLFGDQTWGPAGTYFWDSSVASNHHWHILDQLLLRPSLASRLCNLQILAADGCQSLLSPDGVASRDHLSDRLPILFQLDI